MNSKVEEQMKDEHQLGWPKSAITEVCGRFGYVKQRINNEWNLLSLLDYHTEVLRILSNKLHLFKMDALDARWREAQLMQLHGANLPCHVATNLIILQQWTKCKYHCLTLMTIQLVEAGTLGTPKEISASCSYGNNPYTISRDLKGPILTHPIPAKTSAKEISSWTCNIEMATNCRLIHPTYG